MDIRFAIALIEAAQLSPLQRYVKRLPKVVLNAGTILYHGTDATERFVIPRGPAFFDPRAELAQRWIGYSKAPGQASEHARLMAFKVTQDVQLLDFSMKGQDRFEKLAEIATDGNSYYRPTVAAELLGLIAGWSWGEIMLVEPERYLEPVDS